MAIPTYGVPSGAKRHLIEPKASGLCWGPSGLGSRRDIAPPRPSDAGRQLPPGNPPGCPCFHGRQEPLRFAGQH